MPDAQEMLAILKGEFRRRAENRIAQLDRRYHAPLVGQLAFSFDRPQNDPVLSHEAQLADYCRLKARVLRGYKADLKAVEAYDRSARLGKKTSINSVTELPSRHLFVDDLLRAHSGTRASVAMLDLDKLKMVNDEYGHQMGDKALKVNGDLLVKAANAASRRFKVKASVYHFGGDEFSIVVRGDQSKKAIAAIANSYFRLKKARDASVKDPVSQTSFSIGIAHASDGDLFKAKDQADELSYRVKKFGGNGVLEEEQWRRVDATHGVFLNTEYNTSAVEVLREHPTISPKKHSRIISELTHAKFGDNLAYGNRDTARLILRDAPGLHGFRAKVRSPTRATLSAPSSRRGRSR